MEAKKPGFDFNVSKKYERERGRNVDIYMYEPCCTDYVNISHVINTISRMKPSTFLTVSLHMKQRI